MFQPRAKLEFVRRYLDPAEGWLVHVDIDASEGGLTGGERRDDAARQRQRAMKLDAESVRAKFADIGVAVGGARRAWFSQFSLPEIPGDHDILAFHGASRLVAIAEVEGLSSGQPEQKLYRAVGQIVMAMGAPVPDGWRRSLFVVVCGEAIAGHLRRASAALERLSVSAVALSSVGRLEDSWIVGSPPANEGSVG